MNNKNYSIKIFNLIAFTKISNKWYIDIGKKNIEGCLSKRFSKHYGSIFSKGFDEGYEDAEKQKLQNKNRF